MYSFVFVCCWTHICSKLRPQSLNCNRWKSSIRVSRSNFDVPKIVHRKLTNQTTIFFTSQFVIFTHQIRFWTSLKRKYINICSVNIIQMVNKIVYLKQRIFCVFRFQDCLLSTINWHISFLKQVKKKKKAFQ